MFLKRYVKERSALEQELGLQLLRLEAYVQPFSGASPQKGVQRHPGGTRSSTTLNMMAAQRATMLHKPHLSCSHWLLRPAAAVL